MPAINKAHKQLTKLTEYFFDSLWYEFRYYMHCGFSKLGNLREAYTDMEPGTISDFYPSNSRAPDEVVNLCPEYPILAKRSRSAILYWIAFEGYKGEECLATNIESQFLLPDNDKWHKGLFNHFCHTHDSHNDSSDDILLMGERLKAAAELRNILSGGATIETIKAFTGALDKMDKGVFNQRRNPKWDKFCNAVSIIIFPLAGLRAIKSWATRDTARFWLSNSQAFVHSSRQKVKHLQDEEKKPKKAHKHL